LFFFLSADAADSTARGSRPESLVLGGIPSDTEQTLLLADPAQVVEGVEVVRRRLLERVVLLQRLQRGLDEPGRLEGRDDDLRLDEDTWDLAHHHLLKQGERLHGEEPVRPSRQATLSTTHVKRSSLLSKDNRSCQTLFCT
jgi:hypothetical protein